MCYECRQRVIDTHSTSNLIVTVVLLPALFNRRSHAVW
jgi:hypothetical protein